MQRPRAGVDLDSCRWVNTVLALRGVSEEAAYSRISIVVVVVRTLKTFWDNTCRAVCMSSVAKCCPHDVCLHKLEGVVSDVPPSSGKGVYCNQMKARFLV